LEEGKKGTGKKMLSGECIGDASATVVIERIP